MTVILDRASSPSLVAEAPAGEPAPAGATPPRNFFDGCDTVYELERYEFPAGPANPNSRTLAEVVAEAVA